ncbi:unnamed protein product [Penicillium pancosmium]
MQTVIQLGRVARERRTVSLKTPIMSLVVISDAQRTADIESLESYVQEELNVRNLILATDGAHYGLVLEAKVDWPSLGKKLKKNLPIVRKALPSLTQDQLQGFQRDQKMAIGGIELEVLNKERNQRDQTDGQQWEPAFSDNVVVLLDAAPHPELLGDGMARELLSRVQRLRKKASLSPTDDARMQYVVLSNPDDINVESLVSSREELFKASLRGDLQMAENDFKGSNQSHLADEECSVANLTLRLRLFKA